MRLARMCLFLTLLTPVPAAAGPTDTLIRITANDCRRLTAHAPRPDVAHQPGRDVRGRPVAPADLGGGAQLPVGEITIPIEIDLADRVPASRRIGRPEAKAQIGTVTFRDGQAPFNGLPHGDYEQHAVTEACKARGFR